MAPITIVRNDVDACRVKLDIEIPKERTDGVYRDTLKVFKQKAKVPGFRPGRVPQGLIERQFATQIASECTRELLHLGLREVLERPDFTPDTMPRVQDEDKLSFTSGEAFVFSVSMEVEPTFDMPEYKGIRVAREKAQVEDGQVDAFIDSWRQQRTSYVKVERASQPGDMVRVSFAAVLADSSLEVPEAASFYLSSQGTFLTLREPELIPGTQAALTGVVPGEQREVDVAFPADFHETALAGQKAHYTFTVLEVHASEMPALDDSLAKSMGAESMEDMRQRIRGGLEAEQRNRAEQVVRQRVLNAVLSGLDFPLPASRLRMQTHNVLSRLFESERRRGTTPEQLRERRDELQRRAEQEAVLDLRRYYVLRRIARAEGIETDQQQVGNIVAYFARTHGLAPKVMARRLQESGQLEGIAASVLEQQVLERLTELADIVEETGGKE